MSQPQAQLFAQEFLEGFADMLATMLGGNVAIKPSGDAEPCTADALAGLTADYGALLRASAGEGAAVAVLLPAGIVYAISADFLGKGPEPQDPLDPAHGEEFNELFSNCLGSGVSVFKERHGEVIALDDAQTLPGGAEAANGLGILLGEASWQTPFILTAQDGNETAGVFVFSQGLEAFLPEETPAGNPAEGGADAADPTGGGLEQSEVDAILGAAGVPDAPPPPPPQASPKAAEGRQAPPNLDMVLDIRLVAKARLGRVEMPIGDILDLGPGSVIDVGHLVDEPIELLVNDKLVARGDVVIVEEKFGLRITEIVSQKERIESLR